MFDLDDDPGSSYPDQQDDHEIDEDGLDDILSHMQRDDIDEDDDLADEEFDSEND